MLSKIPKIQKSGNAVKDDDMDTMRTAFCYIVENLWQEPQRSMAKQQPLVRRVPSDQGVDDEELAKVLHHVGQIPLAKLKEAMEYDDDPLRHLLMMVTALPLSLILLAECNVRRRSRRCSRTASSVLGSIARTCCRPSASRSSMGPARGSWQSAAFIF